MANTEEPLECSSAACEADQSTFFDMKARIILLEKTVEEWGKRCDEADEIEQQLRIQLYESSEKWKQERISLMQTIENLQKQNAKLTVDLMKLQGTDTTEKLELENLRSEKKIWLRDKKKKNEENAMLTARIIALRNELRRLAGKNSGDLSPSVALCNMVAFGDVENTSTPPRNPAVEPKLPTTSKRKSNKSALSFRNEMQCQPCSFDESP